MPEIRQFDAIARQCAEHCVASSDPLQCVADFAKSLPLNFADWSQSDADALAGDALRIIAFIRSGGTP
jgi:hypothetical protein